MSTRILLYLTIACALIFIVIGYVVVKKNDTEIPFSTPSIGELEAPQEPQGESQASSTVQEEIQSPDVNEPSSAGLANPASVYCLEHGGTLEITKDAEGGAQGICKFSDGTECDEWQFFRGECKPVELE